MTKKHEIEEFVFSFLIPHGGTETPPSHVNVYAGRWEGRPALFSFGSHHPLAIREAVDAGHENVWAAWLVNPTRPTRETSMHLNALQSSLERCKYERCEGAVSIEVRRSTVAFEIWMRKDQQG